MPFKHLPVHIILQTINCGVFEGFFYLFVCKYIGKSITIILTSCSGESISEKLYYEIQEDPALQQGLLYPNNP